MNNTEADKRTLNDRVVNHFRPFNKDEVYAMSRIGEKGKLPYGLKPQHAMVSYVRQDNFTTAVIATAKNLFFGTSKRNKTDNFNEVAGQMIAFTRAIRQNNVAPIANLEAEIANLPTEIAAEADQSVKKHGRGPGKKNKPKTEGTVETSAVNSDGVKLKLNGEPMKRRGRLPGVKNKPKTDTVEGVSRAPETTYEEDVAVVAEASSPLGSTLGVASWDDNADLQTDPKKVLKHKVLAQMEAEIKAEEEAAMMATA